MGISLPLERNIAISLPVVAILNETQQPFHEIQEIKWDVEQFPLLGVVNTLMVNHIFVDP